MDHSKGFLSMVDECRPRIREITSEEAKSRMESGAGVVLVDVREDSEWAEGRILGAVHLGKGVLERDLEKTIPGTGT
jgi:rhodanese-related sulfurtransferase